MYIAGGVEAVSRNVRDRAVRVPPQARRLRGLVYNVYIPMGLTAENVAEEYGVTREQQDEWAVDLAEPRRRGPRERPLRQGDRPGHDCPTATSSRQDDGPRPGTTVEKLAALQPAFKPDGTVTAGNACPLNDGAAAVLVMSEEKAKSLGLKPRARIIASTVAAIRPEIMGIGPIPAIQKLLEQHGHDDRRHRRRRDQRGLRGADRARAWTSWASRDEKLNPFGGAIALGHPFGMTGARIMTTLLNDLETLDGTYGIESMCVAGGMGMAMLVERLN